MERRTWLDRHSLSAFTLGAVGALLTGSGIAVAANTDLVQVVNAVLAVDVVNDDPIPVDVGGTLDAYVVNAAPARAPFQFYGSIPAEGIEIAVVPDGQRLVITNINGDEATDTDFLALFVQETGEPTDRFYWDYEGYLDIHTLIYAEAGETVKVFEGSFLDSQPNVAITGYYELL